VHKVSTDEARQAALDAAAPAPDPFRNIHSQKDYEEPDLRKVPLSPDADVLLFIRDHNPYMSEWERDLLTIVHEQAQYFIPQIETKIMNEGWASYWHKQIVDSLELEDDLHFEFIVRHNQVICPHEGGLNPYHLGFRIWEDIRRRGDEETSGGGLEEMFLTRESDRDTAFLRRHLTEHLIRELDLFQYEQKGDDLVISQVADESGWREVKSSLIANVGMGAFPVIHVEDGDFGEKRAVYLVHVHDGRDLEPEYAERTLSFVHRLWQREVVLETTIEGKRSLLVQNDHGFSVKAAKSSRPVGRAHAPLRTLERGDSRGRVLGSDGGATCRSMSIAVESARKSSPC
jgi:stage V sporulation protein R